MDVREKLVELLSHSPSLDALYGYPSFVESAEWLIANGVTVSDEIEELRADNNRLRNMWAKVVSDLSKATAHGVTVQELALPEQDYYVLRNTETGMYFRGKGVNRWGKHFNQATIYRVKGTAEHSIKEVSWHGEKAELVRIKIVEMPQPPKGE